MIRKISLIIGIILFFLIMCASYIQFGSSSNNKMDENNNINNTAENETETSEVKDVVYKGKLPIPVENFIKVSSKFGLREAHGVVHSNHTGIDLCGSIGSKVMAAKDGEIVHAGWQGGYGNCVEIKHTNEDGTIFYTFYAHMRDNSLQVTTGQKVITGQVIGTQGATGNATGDHLHFEIRTNGGSNKYAIDPASYLFDEVH